VLDSAKVSTSQHPWPPIGQLLLEKGRVTPADLEAALAEQRTTGERLGEILVGHGLISRMDLAGALSKQWSWLPVWEQGGSGSRSRPPSPASEESVEPGPVVVADEPTSLEEPERVLRELQARMREADAQFAADEARVAALEATVTELVQATAAVTARLEAQSRVIEYLRGAGSAERERLAAAVRALVA